MSESPFAAQQWNIGCTAQFGSMNGHPIDWVVIRSRDNCRLLLSLGPIAQRRMGKCTTSYWEKSELRKWLNTDVLHEAFTEEEQHQICRFGDDYLSLLSKDQLSFWSSLPDCVLNCGFQWWLLSTQVTSEDNDFHYVERNGKQSKIRCQRADNIASVRPVIALSLDAAQTTLPSTFFDYYVCPFCGTNNTNNTKPCTCCGFALRRNLNMLQGKYRATGCLTAVFTASFLFIGIIGLMSAAPLGLLLIIASIFVLILGLNSRSEKQHEIHNARKYENETDHAIPLHTCKRDHERTAAIYHNAGILQKNATNAEDYHYAANMYALIPDYQDAVAQREACLKAAKGGSTSDT